MELLEWSHKYHYEFKSSRHIDRVGTRITGVVQLFGAHTEQEVAEFSKKLFHGFIDDAELISIKLISVRSLI